MPLLTCPDCGKGVSSMASSCPGCGRPVDSFSDGEVNKQNSVSANLALFSLGFGGVMIGLVAYFISPNIPWWGYLILYMVASGTMFKGLVRDQANSNLSDRV